MCNPENESSTVLISDGATSMSTMVPLSPGSDGELFDVLA